MIHKCAQHIYVQFSPLKFSNTVLCRYNAVQYNMMLHTTLQWLKSNINQNFNPRKTPLISPVVEVNLPFWWQSISAFRCWLDIAAFVALLLIRYSSVIWVHIHRVIRNQISMIEWHREMHYVVVKWQSWCLQLLVNRALVVRRAGLLWSQEDFEWRRSVPLFKCLTVLEFSFILFDLCLLITFFNFIMNYVPIVTFWIFTYHKIWILSIMFCSIWSYWIIYFLACLEVSWRVVS